LCSLPSKHSMMLLLDGCGPEEEEVLGGSGAGDTCATIFDGGTTANILVDTSI